MLLNGYCELPMQHMTMVYVHLTCPWGWLILIIICEPMGHQYYTHVHMLDIIHLWGTAVLCELLSLYSILLQTHIVS